MLLRVKAILLLKFLLTRLSLSLRTLRKRRIGGYADPIYRAIWCERGWNIDSNPVKF